MRLVRRSATADRVVVRGCGLVNTGVMMRSMLLAAGMTLGFTVVTGAQETPIQLQTNTGTLHGTLLFPASTTGPVPVALIIAGSGPTDRDGNSAHFPGKNNALKMVAEELAKQGIASVRYDKRGMAASMAAGMGRQESDVRFTMFVDDAVGWLELLRADKRFSRRIVVGHSEGSLIGIMAAQRSPTSVVVSLSGAGRPIADALEEQLSRGLSPELQTEARRILSELKAGRTVDSVPPQLRVVFRPSVQPYMISWMSIDPARELSRLTIPVLVVQGTTDIQISVADAQRLVKDNPHATLEIIEGMNHVLKQVRDTTQPPPSYYDPTLALHPRLIEVLARFFAR